MRGPASDEIATSLKSVAMRSVLIILIHVWRRTNARASHPEIHMQFASRYDSLRSSNPPPITQDPLQFHQLTGKTFNARGEKNLVSDEISQHLRIPDSELFNNEILGVQMSNPLILSIEKCSFI